MANSNDPKLAALVAGTLASMAAGGVQAQASQPNRTAAPTGISASAQPGDATIDHYERLAKSNGAPNTDSAANNELAQWPARDGTITIDPSNKNQKLTPEERALANGVYERWTKDPATQGLPLPVTRILTPELPAPRGSKMADIEYDENRPEVITSQGKNGEINAAMLVLPRTTDGKLLTANDLGTPGADMGVFDEAVANNEALAARQNFFDNNHGATLLTPNSTAFSHGEAAGIIQAAKDAWQKDPGRSRDNSPVPAIATYHPGSNDPVVYNTGGVVVIPDQIRKDGKLVPVTPEDVSGLYTSTVQYTRSDWTVAPKPVSQAELATLNDVLMGERGVIDPDFSKAAQEIMRSGGQDTQAGRQDIQNRLENLASGFPGVNVKALHDRLNSWVANPSPAAPTIDPTGGTPPIFSHLPPGVSAPAYGNVPLSASPTHAAGDKPHSATHAGHAGDATHNHIPDHVKTAAHAAAQAVKHHLHGHGHPHTHGQQEGDKSAVQGTSEKTLAISGLKHSLGWETPGTPLYEQDAAILAFIEGPRSQQHLPTSKPAADKGRGGRD